MNDKRKFSFTIVLLVMLSVLLTGCAAGVIKFQSDDNEDSGISNVGESEKEVSLETEEDGLIISYYSGRLSTVDGLVLYDIITKQLEDHQYVMDLQFCNNDSKEQVQQFSYPLRNDFMPETVQKPLQIDDINSDGSYDLILDLGIYGKIKLALCYVYDPKQKGYVQLAGFDELMTPHFEKGYIFEEWRGEFYEYGRNKYQVIGNEMVLEASLFATYGGSPNPVYTEKVLINGEMVIIKENVTAKEIDASEWNYSLP